VFIYLSSVNSNRRHIRIFIRKMHQPISDRSQRYWCILINSTSEPNIRYLLLSNRHNTHTHTHTHNTHTHTHTHTRTQRGREREREREFYLPSVYMCESWASNIPDSSETFLFFFFCFFFFEDFFLFCFLGFSCSPRNVHPWSTFSTLWRNFDKNSHVPNSSNWSFSSATCKNRGGRGGWQ